MCHGYRACPGKRKQQSSGPRAKATSNNGIKSIRMLPSRTPAAARKKPPRFPATCCMISGQNGPSAPKNKGVIAMLRLLTKPTLCSKRNQDLLDILSPASIFRITHGIDKLLNLGGLLAGVGCLLRVQALEFGESFFAPSFAPLRTERLPESVVDRRHMEG